MSWDNLMIDTISIHRGTESFVSGTIHKKVYYEQKYAGIKARIEQLSGDTATTILGRIPTATHRLFLKGTEIKVNDIVKDQNGIEYIVKEVNNLFGHHYEIIMEMK